MRVARKRPDDVRRALLCDAEGLGADALAKRLEAFVVAGVRLVPELFEHLLNVFRRVETRPARVLQEIPDCFSVRLYFGVCHRSDAGGEVDADAPQITCVHAAGSAALECIARSILVLRERGGNAREIPPPRSIAARSAALMRSAMPCASSRARP